MFSFNEKVAKKLTIPSEKDLLPGRSKAIEVQPLHYVLNNDFTGNYPDQMETIVFAMGCFWGAERLFWSCEGVYTTAVGYVGGGTRNPIYEEVCSGMTGHTEGVLVVYDPHLLDLKHLLKLFWEQHDPTQGMRQGNDVGTQYRSAIFCRTEAQFKMAQFTKNKFQIELSSGSLGEITTEIDYLDSFYFAETWHQQYLAKNPNGYCGLKGVGACLKM